MKSTVKTDNKMLSDEEVVERVINGEKYLYENIMRKYNSSLFRISMSIINDSMEAEDIMQTVYLNAYLQLSKFQNKSSFSTWIIRILINESLLRKKKKTKEKQMVMEKQTSNYNNYTPLKGLMNKELKAILEKTILALPEKYRLVFVMREIEEMSINETMGALSLSESNVKVRLNRAKEILRNNLSSYYKSEQVFEFNLIRCDKVVNYVMEEINQNKSN
ncbi:MAG: sigma-70 family RNA polymerase sigma factor [Bacteroidota bacterium]